jgi:hypothetical protein
MLFMKIIFALINAAILALLAWYVFTNPVPASETMPAKPPATAAASLAAATTAAVFGFVAYLVLSWLSAVTMSVRDKLHTSPFDFWFKRYIIASVVTVVIGALGVFIFR